MTEPSAFDLLLSLPPNMCEQLSACEPLIADRAFTTHDPPEYQLGSGGGTAYVLEQAWRASGNPDFNAWLLQSGKLIIHGGGESRRLPAYAPSGKLFIPIPVFRWSIGQRLNQNLLDLAEPNLQRLAAAAGPSSRVMVASGDVFVRLDGPLPAIPEADVVFFGLWTTPEEASNFGVMFTSPTVPERLITFLQKPTPETIREKSRNQAFLIDAGIWLLSSRAVACLMEKSGWNQRAGTFTNVHPDTYDLYGSWAHHLGDQPVSPDSQVSALTTAVVPLPDAGFYHFGTGADLLDSLYDIQNLVTDQSKLGSVATMAQPRQFLQNAHVEVPLHQEGNHSLWIENCHIPGSWTLNSRHILTGIPENDWELKLEAGVCLDFVPVGNGIMSLRPYGYDDLFRGQLSQADTKWLGRPFDNWINARNISYADAGLAEDCDIQSAPLFPLLEIIEPGFITWMFTENPELLSATEQKKWRTQWLNTPRLSSRELSRKADLSAIYQSRNYQRREILPVMAGHADKSVFYKLDLESVAADYAESGYPLPPPLGPEKVRNPLTILHERMFRSTVLQIKGNVSASADCENEAFGLLHSLIVTPLKKQLVSPRHTLLEDQIVWGRSPVRLDMAGGWADTPPYCLEKGGSVVNMAVDLNGQPPIQVFARRTREPVLSIRSIDLGLAETLTTYQEIGDYRNPDNGFALARAAFALTGFHPEFNGGIYNSLAAQLESMGGGVEISMMAAIPKGSGLGTSSVLAATILGVVSDMTGLNWSKYDISRRTLALEQMLSSGGGWQDQVGGLFPGIKLITTQPGISQEPEIRWLPESFFYGAQSSCLMLFYTGITRAAKDILGEIVRGIFLNSGDRLNTVDAIAANAHFCSDAVQKGDFDSFAESVHRSWILNQRLDTGTNPSGVQDIFDRISHHMSAAKLLGAGGGGYLFIIAKDIEAARKIRVNLETDPPNPGARFVDMTLSRTGLQVTRS